MDLLDISVEPPQSDTTETTDSSATQNETVQQPSITIDGELENHFGITSIFTTKFWKYFFDVDSVIVLKRILNSLLVNKSRLYNDFNSTKPDLYGPFWMTTSIILFLCIFSNIIHYVEYLLQYNRTPFEWRFVCLAFFFYFPTVHSYLYFGLDFYCD